MIHSLEKTQVHGILYDVSSFQKSSTSIKGLGCQILKTKF